MPECGAADAEHKMRFACWLHKAIGKHAEYVEHTAFSRQKWLLNRTTLRLYVYFDLVLRLCCWSTLTIGFPYEIYKRIYF